MILSEQKYSNLNKIYYRGLKNKNDNYRKYDEIYLTTKFLYAFAYAGFSGIVKQYRLRKEANIFNMKCKTDEANLRKYCQSKSYLSGYLKYFEKLKENDWSVITGGDYYRQSLVNAIKNLGYDGYFNYEIDKEYYELCKDYPWFNLSELQIKSPAIAIFNENALQELPSLQGENLKSSIQIKQIREIEKSYILKKSGNVERRQIISFTDKEFDDLIKIAKSDKNRTLQEEYKKLAELNYFYRNNKIAQKQINSFIKSSRFLKDELNYFEY